MEYYSAVKRNEQLILGQKLYLLLIKLYSYGADYLPFLSYTSKNTAGKECSSLTVVWEVYYLGQFVLGVAVSSVTLT